MDFLSTYSHLIIENVIAMSLKHEVQCHSSNQLAIKTDFDNTIKDKQKTVICKTVAVIC